MKASLSTYEFRAYPKATGFVWLYLRGHVLFHTNSSFSVDAYLRDMVGDLTLPDGSTHALESLSIDAVPTAKFDGKHLLHGISAVVPTELNRIVAGIGWLRLGFEFDFHGARTVARVEHEAVVRQVRFARPAVGRKARGVVRRRGT